MEPPYAEAGFVFLLRDDERAALVRILRVVDDNWWLDETERALLERLDGSLAPVALPAA